LRRVRVGTILIGMPIHKLRFFAWSWALILAGICPHTSASQALERSEPTHPTISLAHRVLLSRTARRTVRDAVLRRPKYTPEYVPHALRDLSFQVVVRLNEHGYLRATAAAGPNPVALAVRDAAHAAALMLLEDKSTDLHTVNSLLIEIEVVGRSQPITVDGDWTLPRVIDPFVEPGVHGLSFAGKNLKHQFCPTELFTSDMILSQALERLAQSAGQTPAQLSKVQLQRFRTVHWYQVGSSDNIVSLHRGLTVLPQGATTQEAFDATITHLAEYMAYRQQETGLFAYQYEPGNDKYSDKQNLVRQVGAVLAMATHARWSRSSASTAAADLGIRYHLQGLTDFPGAADSAYIATADGQNKLGVTALLCLTLAEHPEVDRYSEVRRRLINGILELQQPSGMLITAFPPAVSLKAQNYFPGEALLALSADYGLSPNARVLDAFHQAINFYRPYFRETRSPAFVPWQVQAFAKMAKHTKRQDYADYVFELSDWLAHKQLDPSNCAWPELFGGIAAYDNGRAGVSTAAYLEGFADALMLANALGNKQRADRYSAVVRRAARFVMQLQVRPKETYFMHSPQDAVGGIRTSPSLNLLRIDHCQHALVGLIKARQALYGERE